LLWAGVVCVAAVMVEVGIVTDGFDLIRKPSAATSPPAPLTNPYNETIQYVNVSINYSGSAPTGLIDPSTNICPGCPGLPLYDTYYSPPRAGVWFYFNISNPSKTAYATLANFTITTSGANPGLFTLIGIDSSYPEYDENVTNTWPAVPPMQNLSFAGLATATSLPYDGPTGYTLTLDFDVF
jgi:hypothetical protein